MVLFCFMASLPGEQIQVHAYNLSEIDFVTPVKLALDLEEAEDLAQLHEKFTLDSIVTRETDSTTAIHRQYYANIGQTGFTSLYKEFIHNVIANLVDGPIIIQKVPTFRAHLPGNKAVGKYHRDSDFGHQAAAINFWIPLTDAFDTNTIHIAQREDDTPQPVDVSLGELLAFDAVGLVHGNEINETGRSRVSFDFRVIPQSQYVKSHRQSVNTLSTLAIGDYYIFPEDL